MTSITLQTASPREVTVLTNDFIDNYMPRANGEFVKVYIHLLRLLSDGTTPFSLEQMADHFFCRERYPPRPEILGKRKTPDFKLSGQRRNFLYYPDRTKKAE